MKSFVRVTKLNNVQNRADYIHDPKRQEEIVCKSESVDYSEYQRFEAAKRKPGERSYEGRELVIAIPNEWYDLPRAELYQRAEFLVDKALGKTEDVAWAVHWNKDRTNLHIQAVFSERQKEKNPGVWDRTIYQSKDGGVARRKADRAVNEDGSFIVLHKKGEVKGGFTSKDPGYTKPEWLPKVKKELQQTMEQQYGVKFAKPGVLHEYHEGKGDSAPATAATNVLIRANNEQEQLIRSSFPLMPETEIRAVMMEAVNACGVVRVGADAIYLERHFEVMRGEPLQIPEGEYVLPPPDGVLRSPEQLQAYKEVVLQKEPEQIEAVLQKAPAEPKIEVKAAPAQPDPKQPEVTLDVLVPAQTEYYCQAVAIRDTSRYQRAEIIEAPERLRNAMNTVREQHEQKKVVNQEVTQLPRCPSMPTIALPKKKKAVAAAIEEWKASVFPVAQKIREKLETIKEKIGASFEILKIHLDPHYLKNEYGDPIDPEWLKDSDISRLEQGVRAKLPDLEAAADYERRHYKPLDAPRADPEAYNDAKDKYVALLSRVPSEGREKAREGLQQALNDHPRYGNPLAVYGAYQEVQKVLNDHLPAPQRERTRMLDQHKSHDTGPTH